MISVKIVCSLIFDNQFITGLLMDKLMEDFLHQMKNPLGSRIVPIQAVGKIFAALEKDQQKIIIHGIRQGVPNERWIKMDHLIVDVFPFLENQPMMFRVVENKNISCGNGIISIIHMIGAAAGRDAGDFQGMMGVHLCHIRPLDDMIAHADEGDTAAVPNHPFAYWQFVGNFFFLGKMNWGRR